MKTKITLQGFTPDGEWFAMEVDLVDATIDLVPEDWGDRLSIQPASRGVNVTHQSLSRNVLTVRPVSTNSIDLVQVAR